MTDPAPMLDRPATYEDVLNAPPNSVAEVIGGALHTHPRPAMTHVFAGSNLQIEIGAPFGRGRGGPGGWWILVEPELHLSDDILVPDLAGWRRETMPEYPEAAYCEITPDWACEILSPSTEKLDRHEKRAVYARQGVSHLWLIDPKTRGLEAFELQEGNWVLIASLQDDADVSVRPFDAITFPLSTLWP